jgi:serine/threonine protein kinase
VDSKETAEVHATADQLLNRMSRLLPGQVEELLLRAKIPSEYLPGLTASLMERVIAALRYMEHQGRLDQLAELLDIMSAERKLEPRRSPPPRPDYPSLEIRALSDQLENARTRKQSLQAAGIPTNEVDTEIIQLRRKLRDGALLRAGADLGDGRYVLIKPLGLGGFAMVWEAHDTLEKRPVAIKVLHHHLAGDQQRRERFFRGARIMSELDHDAVVRVLAPQGEDEHFYYFVMELVPGGNLRDAILGNRVKPLCILPLILQVGDALAEAHKRKLIHRDVKPTNILLNEHGNAKLTDFDLVGATDTTGGTRTGALGTVFYSAPECLDTPQQATARADVFSLGMTTIFCLSGKDISMSAFRNPDVTINQLDYSAAVREVLAQAVALEPEDRFADAAAMMDTLRSALDDAYAGRARTRAIPTAKGDFVTSVLPGDRATREAPGRSRDADNKPMNNPPRHTPALESGRDRSGRARQTLNQLRRAPEVTSVIVGVAMLMGVLFGGVGHSEERSIYGERPHADNEALLAKLYSAYSLPGEKSSFPDAASDSCPDDMMHTPAAMFPMGNPEEIGHDEKHPQHWVTLSAFCIDKTEVTVAAYARCVAAGKCSAPFDGHYVCNGNRTDRQNEPVNCVDWNRATAYCTWLGRRLPTMTEIEYITRGYNGDRRLREWTSDHTTESRANSTEPRDGTSDSEQMSGSASEAVIPTTNLLETYARDLAPRGQADIDNNVGFRCARDD